MSFTKTQKKGSAFFISLVFALIVLSVGARAAFNDFDEHTANYLYYNSPAHLLWIQNDSKQQPWPTGLGDWADKNNVSQGTTPYDNVTIISNGTARWVEWNATLLAQQWVSGMYSPQGFIIRDLNGVTGDKFTSRENGTFIPQLNIVTTTGTYNLTAVADTYIDSSTTTPSGTYAYLQVETNENTLVRFNLTGVTGTVTDARLRLYTFYQYTGNMNAGIFRLNQDQGPTNATVRWGIAANYINDSGITSNPNVIYADGFESPTWFNNWTLTNYPREGGVTNASDPSTMFSPFINMALWSRIIQNNSEGMSFRYIFPLQNGSMPTEMYFRYYFRFGNDWGGSLDGKLPGFADIISCGNGCDGPCNGVNGWSTRGLHEVPVNDSTNPLNGRVPIGSYVYHMDSTYNCGDHYLWDIGYGGYLQRDRWYSLEQYVKMNTPGQANGIVMAWVDGRLAANYTNFRFVNATGSTLAVHDMYGNVYHGGTIAAPNNMTLYVDNVVFAKSYIGPMNLTGVSGGNNAPVAVNDSASTNKNNAVTVLVLANDYDPDNDVITIQSVTQPSHGSVTNNSANVTYTPTVGYYGTDVFTYNITDGKGGSAVASVNLQVVNRNPVAVNDSASMNKNTPTTIFVLANDSDPDGDTVSVSSVVQPSHGSVVNNVYNVTYTPTTSYSGSDSFTYTISDGSGGTATATVSVTVVNRAPTAVNDNANTGKNNPVVILVLANDNDPDGDNLLVQSVTTPGNGSVVNNYNNVTYTPNSNFVGSDSFSYTINDSSGGTASATVSVTVTGGSSAVYNLSATKDTNLDSSTYHGYGDYNNISVAPTSQNILMSFDLSQFGTGAVVNNATLWIYNEKQYSGTAVLGIFRTANLPWIEGTYAAGTGATRDDYDRGQLLPWVHYMGDWYDANGVAQGNTSYFNVSIPVTSPKWVAWDVTSLTQAWVSGTYGNQGFFIRDLSGPSEKFWSREYTDPTLRPYLQLNVTA